MKSNNRSSRAKARRFCNSRRLKSKGDTPLSLVIMHDVTDPLPTRSPGSLHSFAQWLRSLLITGPLSASSSGSGNGCVRI